ncbi:c-type cytochrome [Sulfurimonas marina]|uniref:C-type cytochrome n=1 Tax=Sulfurimonas marina TaxID=2590551 RepID=A0A7M1AXR8_9BACT|nr:c-type cytochrome [Sulfurimonas marina]QOP42240.1 c-type cytochrome [Sulfurimonas marina]
MIKISNKLLVSASVAALVSFGFSGCMETSAPVKHGMDGGVYYPIANGKTGPYHVNTTAHDMTINNGRVPTEDEYNAWNSDVMPDGTGLPEGEGTVEEGEEVYEAKCVMCHGDFGSGGGGYPALSKGNAYAMYETLTRQRLKPDTDGPSRFFGSYWAQASTMWWYIKDAMPHPATDTLTDDEVYALVAYVLNVNEMEIDGVPVDEDYVLNRENFLKIKMPAKDVYEPVIDGPQGPENVRAYYANPDNFGAVKVKRSERCMTNCQEPTVHVAEITVGISDFHPPMSAVRDLPAEEGSSSFDAKTAYTEACAMCHDTGAAPAPGDKGAWAPLLAKGMDAVYKNGLNGTDAGMPAKGGSSLSDKEFKLVVDYIVNQSK